MRNWIAWTAMVLNGCVSCPSIYTPSVSVDVVDANGDRIPGVEVTYTVDGGRVELADCILGTDADEPCMTFWTRSGSGDYVVTATLDVQDPQDPACSFQDSETVELTITSDRCNVEGQTVTLELDPTQRVCE